MVLLYLMDITRQLTNMDLIRAKGTMGQHRMVTGAHRPKTGPTLGETTNEGLPLIRNTSLCKLL